MITLRGIQFLGILFILSSTCRADLILRLGDFSGVPAGSSAFVGVFASTTSGTQELESFNFPVDIGPTGVGTPTGIDFGTPSVANFINNDLDFVDPNGNPTVANILGFDRVFAADFGGNSLVVGTSEVKLFDFVFDADGTATGDLFGISIDSASPFFEVADGNGIGFSPSPTSDFNASGSFTPSGGGANVPEPSSIYLMTGVIVIVLFARRFILSEIANRRETCGG